MSYVSTGDAIVNQYLRPMMDCINQEGTVEVQVNRPGEVWIEKRGEAATPHNAPEFTLEYFHRLGEAIANSLNVIDFKRKPFLATTLPGGHRLQLCLGNTVMTGIALSVRVATDEVFPLDNYRATPADYSALDNYTPELIGADLPFVDALLAGIKAKMNLVLSGGTFAGKTRFARALLDAIPPEDRTIIIQDTPELFLTHLPNRVDFVVNRLATDEMIGYAEVIDAVTRLRPDRVILGELSMENTWTLLRLLNTGHGGLLTTVHANSPELAFEAITQNIALTGKDNDPKQASRYFREVIDMVAQIKRIPGSSRRVITDLYRKENA